MKKAVKQINLLNLCRFTIALVAKKNHIDQTEKFIKEPSKAKSNYSNNLLYKSNT